MEKKGGIKINPFLIFGGSSKQRQEWALEVAKKNGWNFWEVSRNTFEEELYKTSLTSNLDNKPNIIFLHNADALTQAEMDKFFKFVEKSPHRFILSAKSLYKISKSIREKTHIVRIGEPTPDEFFEALNQLMLNPDREEVRRILAKNEKDVEGLLHILKNNIWKVQNPQVWHAVESCMNLLYKISPEFQVSLLAYLFPVCKVPLSYEKKDNIYIAKKHILRMIERRYKMSIKESLEQIRVIQELAKNSPKLGWDLGLELELNDEECKFLGLVEQPKQSSSLNLLQVTQEKGLEKWF